MTLYELKGAAAELYELLSADEIDEQTFADTLESIGANEKIESYCRVIKQLEADIKTDIDAQIAVLAEEIDRLKAVKARKQSNIDSMKYRLQEFIEACGGQKQKGVTFTAFLRDTKSVKITDEAALPGEYMTVKTTSAPNKTAIKEALDRGEKITGAEIEVTRSVQIR